MPAASHDADEHSRNRADVEHRQRMQRHVVRRHRECRRLTERTARKVAVRKHYPLGATGRSAGVEQHRKVVACSGRGTLHRGTGKQRIVGNAVSSAITDIDPFDRVPQAGARRGYG